MTTPDEEARAIASVRQFLYDLMSPQATPRVPAYVRQRARRVSKHYPILPAYGGSISTYTRKMKEKRL